MEVERDSLSHDVDLHSTRVQHCQKDVIDTIAMQGNMRTLLERVSTTNLFDNVQGKLSHANQDWDGIKVKYKDLKSCFQQVMEFFHKARTFATAKKAYITLKLKLDVVDSLIASTCRSIKGARKRLSMSQGYSKDGIGSSPIAITSKPISHHTFRTTKPKMLPLKPCPMCNCFFQLLDMLMATCGCMCHCWCIGLHLQQSKHCARESCGTLFNNEWATSVGFKMVEDRLPKVHPQAQQNGIAQILPSS